MCRNGRTDRVVDEIAVEGKETMPTKESEFAIAGSTPAFFPMKEAHRLFRLEALSSTLRSKNERYPNERNEAEEVNRNAYGVEKELIDSLHLLSLFTHPVGLDCEFVVFSSTEISRYYVERVAREVSLLFVEDAVCFSSECFDDELTIVWRETHLADRKSLGRVRAFQPSRRKHRLEKAFGDFLLDRNLCANECPFGRCSFYLPVPRKERIAGSIASRSNIISAMTFGSVAKFSLSQLMYSPSLVCAYIIRLQAGRILSFKS